MAKGHECPLCGTYTTNQLKCTNCDTVVKKDLNRPGESGDFLV